jgi:flagellin-like protein
MFDKRGIAPLIATLLLISFAVSLGVVIMNFGRAQVELQAQCPINIGLRFAVIGGDNQICYDAGKKDLAFTIENGANIDVTGLVVSIIGTQKAESFELNDAKIAKAGIHIGHVAYDSSAAGEMRQIKISPKVIMYDTEQICIEKALIAENVPPC